MSAEPVQVEDPSDPVAILRDLPEQERGQFLRQYHEAVAELSDRVLRQLGDFPAKAFNALTDVTWAG